MGTRASPVRRVLTIWYLIQVVSIWEFPKTRGPTTDPQIVGLLIIKGHPQKGSPIYRNSHLGSVKPSCETVFIQLQQLLQAFRSLPSCAATSHASLTKLISFARSCHALALYCNMTTRNNMMHRIWIIGCGICLISCHGKGDVSSNDEFPKPYQVKLFNRRGVEAWTLAYVAAANDKYFYTH